MTSKEFLNNISGGKIDVIQMLLNKLAEMNIEYCVIGGLAVNAYAEPVASLDLDLVFTVSDIEKFLNNIEENFNINKFPHSINIQHPDSDLRIQIQTDLRYQTFVNRATNKFVLGYNMNVAKLEDVLKGKIWAYLDGERRKSKRQKDLADIMRLVETYPHLYSLLPENVKMIIDSP